MNARATLVLAILLTALVPLRAQDDLVGKARKALDSGKVKEAMTLLEGSYDKIKNNAEALVILAQCSIKTAQYGKAMDYALRAVELDGQSFDANVAAGRAFYQRAMEAAASERATGGQVQGLFEEAGQFLEQALKLNGKDAALWGLKGECLWRANDPDASAQAAKDYMKAAELEPGNLAWYMGAIKAYQLAKDSAGALQCVNASLKKMPRSAELLLLKGDIHRTSDPANLDEAIASYKAVLKAPDLSAPTDATAANHIWGLLGAKKRMDEALAAVVDWKKAHPKNFNAHWWAGYYAFQLGKTDDAISAFTKAFEVSGKQHAGTAVWVSDCFVKKNELGKAAEWLIKAATIPTTYQNPAQEPMSKLLAICNMHYFNTGNLLGGIGFLKYGSKIDPNHRVMLNNLGLAWRDLAVRERNKAKEYSRKSVKYYEKACKAVMTDARASGTDKAQVFNDTAILYHFPQHKINDITKAVALYRKALAFDPEYIDAIENLGLCMNILGKYEEAVPLFQKVLAKQPGRRVSRGGLRTAEEGLKK